MAYKINRDDEYIVHPNGPATMKEVGNLYSKIMQATPEFYELEPAEVVGINLDEKDLPLNDDDKPDWTQYGWATVKLNISRKNDRETIVARPLDSNIKEYPLPGETVIVARYIGQWYYTQKVNLFNSINFNSAPNIGNVEGKLNPALENRLIHHFNPNSGIRQLLSNEGDITFNGRFGQSIRFGSNITEIEGQDEDTGKENSPNILLRAGQGVEETEPGKPVVEDINKDGSSLWITTDQVVPIKFAAKSKVRHYIEPSAKKLEGKQIILNSDRIVFNSKEKAMYLSSNHSVDISANRGIILEVPDDGGVKLGTFTATQPALGGDQTMKLISLIIDAISEFAGTLTSAVGGPGSPLKPTSLMSINFSASSLKSKLSSIKKRLDEPKSKTVFIGQIRGPK